MGYTNTFISQISSSDFLHFLRDYLLGTKPPGFSFELIFFSDKEDEKSYACYFLEKYKNGIKKYQFADQEILYFEHHILENQEFISDIAHYLENDGYLIMLIFCDIADLAQSYNNGFKSTINNELIRFEIYKLDWEVIKLPNPYLYVDTLPDDIYQRIDNDYDLVNLGQASISLKKPLHITLNLISNSDSHEEQLFNKESTVFQRFNEIVDDISAQLCK